MNMQSKKGSETTNAQGEVERKVETLDHRSSAGKGQEPKSVQVIHQHLQSNQNTRGGVLTGAAAAVVSTLESAKDAISRK
ncbi:uncharacterized protein LOC111300735 [Durio zibethinus]|uniref:Uncharacterized protein LOC111300735 n=1 Tax=Durio zibethinus TaxID=66656 RepID=A0A6P5ZH78_DURZI|nr:uncharacterized protein LOC111300735 [Durio zibethinus]